MKQLPSCWHVCTGGLSGDAEDSSVTGWEWDGLNTHLGTGFAAVIHVQ